MGLSRTRWWASSKTMRGSTRGGGGRGGRGRAVRGAAVRARVRAAAMPAELSVDSRLAPTARSTAKSAWWSASRLSRLVRALAALASSACANARPAQDAPHSSRARPSRTLPLPLPPVNRYTACLCRASTPHLFRPPHPPSSSPLPSYSPRQTGPQTLTGWTLRHTSCQESAPTLLQPAPCARTRQPSLLASRPHNTAGARVQGTKLHRQPQARALRTSNPHRHVMNPPR